MLDFLNNSTVSFDIAVKCSISMWWVFAWFATGLLVTAFLWVNADLHKWSRLKKYLSSTYSAPRLLISSLVCIIFPPLAIYAAWHENNIKHFRQSVYYKIIKKFGSKK